jgi:hypothetical protein
MMMWWTVVVCTSRSGGREGATHLAQLRRSPSPSWSPLPLFLWHKMPGNSSAMGSCSVGSQRAQLGKRDTDEQAGRDGLIEQVRFYRFQLLSASTQSVVADRRGGSVV